MELVISTMGLHVRISSERESTGCVVSVGERELDVMQRKECRGESTGWLVCVGGESKVLMRPMQTGGQTGREDLWCT